MYFNELLKHLQNEGLQKKDIEIIMLGKSDYYAIVDKGSEMVNYNWSPSVTKLKYGEKKIYCQRREGKEVLLIHREILNCPKDKQVHHINNEASDNRIDNLQIVTQTQNLQMRIKSRSNSGYKGVAVKQTKNKGIVYEATIRFNKSQIYLGTYSSPQEAAAAYNGAALKHYGKYSTLNDVDFVIDYEKNKKNKKQKVRENKLKRERNRRVNKCGATGVHLHHYDKNNKPIYQAQKWINGKKVYLGTFPEIELAAKKYNEAS